MRQRNYAIGIRHLVFEPARKLVNRLQNLRREHVVCTHHHHVAVITSEFFVEMRLVYFNLVPVVKPFLFAACHLQLGQPEACQNRHNNCCQQYQPAEFNLKMP